MHKSGVRVRGRGVCVGSLLGGQPVGAVTAAMVPVPAIKTTQETSSKVMGGSVRLQPAPRVERVSIDAQHEAALVRAVHHACQCEQLRAVVAGLVKVRPMHHAVPAYRHNARRWHGEATRAFAYMGCNSGNGRAPDREPCVIVKKPSYASLASKVESHCCSAVPANMLGCYTFSWWEGLAYMK